MRLLGHRLAPGYDRRRSLGDDRVRMVAQRYQLLLELIPGAANKSLSAAQAKSLLAGVRPRHVVGKPDAGWPPTSSVTSSGPTSGPSKWPGC